MDNAILAVFGDGRTAYNVIQSMGRANDEQRIVKRVVALCDNRFKDEMRHIGSSSVKVESVDFGKLRQDAKELERIVSENNVRWLLLMPFGDTFQPGHILPVLEAYKRNRGRNVVLMSHAGADSDMSPVNQMQEAERITRQQFPDSNCVVRCGVTLQMLDFFAEDVKERKTWRLPIGNGKFAPVCLRDDVAACVLAIVREQEIRPELKNQIFTLTNNELIDGNALAQMTNAAFRGDVRFENIGIDEARKIMQRHSGGGGGGQAGAAGRDRLDRHMLSTWELGAALNKFERVSRGALEVVTDHVKRIAGKEPMSVAEYLQKHEENFRPGMIRGQ